MHDSGCGAVQSATHLICLAHLEEEDWKDLLSTLAPGSDLDARGVTFSFKRWAELTARLTDRNSDILKFGATIFSETSLPENADFSRAHFYGEASFNNTQFKGDALFSGARFQGDAWFCIKPPGNLKFDGAQFFRESAFTGSETRILADFSNVQFKGSAEFDCLEFAFANFARACFSGLASFRAAYFSSGVSFHGTQFNDDMMFTFVCDANVSFDYAKISRAVRIQIAANTISLHRAQLESPVVLLLRYARVILTDLALSHPLTVASVPRLFNYEGLADLPEDGLSGDPRAWIEGLWGVDVAPLILSDIDLSRCSFDGAYNLDQIRLEGRCTFADTPRGWRIGKGLPPVRLWTSRQVITEEHDWRANPATNRSALARQGWKGDPEYPESPGTAAATLAVIYRQLRKALEDSKNEPGAADFYYGEMEFRRHDPHTPRGERLLLHGYWLLSGYALRATRALGFLLVAMFLTLTLTVGWGLPNETPKQRLTGVVPTKPGEPITLTTNTADPTLTLPYSKRFTEARAEKASEVVVNSVVFRSSGQNLTTPGVWIEMASRISEPLLLGFAAVAARGRVKR